MRIKKKIDGRKICKKKRREKEEKKIIKKNFLLFYCPLVDYNFIDYMLQCYMKKRHKTTQS